ncbi:uncharacterized protein SCHCODRAFT_01199868 [Schizophyllum commune H4-8]|uniref:Uncharacterized protein n=1 Tax=Schizophyllum commune (strain H4-8 / FGSC 9210) TaxID=578458 RepID=D8PZD4_SCHCM|nr:uncharacterized protein SCHCODRAFT_01199868 [Schizophyllum commune H4-8]KAI5896321.1 hypothetical protein SCHCODRAFT_01199868 [Schizophyllum commune H4-8]
MSGDTVRWSFAADEFMVDEMRNPVNRRAWQAESGWHGITWSSLLAKMLAKGPEALQMNLTHLTSTKIQSHFEKSLKQDWKQVKALRERSGWGWDDVKKMKQLEEEKAKKPKYQKKNKQGKVPVNPYFRWKKKAFPLYDKVAELCEDIVATGEHAFHAGGQATPATPSPPSTSPPTAAPHEASSIPIDPALRALIPNSQLSFDPSPTQPLDDDNGSDTQIETSQGPWVPTPSPSPS